MLDIKEIRENPDLFQKAADAKGCKISIHDLLHLDEQRRKLSGDSDSLRMKLKEGNQKIRTLSKEEKATLESLRGSKNFEPNPGKGDKSFFENMKEFFGA